jgi:hypothetical protein
MMLSAMGTGWVAARAGGGCCLGRGRQSGSQVGGVVYTNGVGRAVERGGTWGSNGSWAVVNALLVSAAVDDEDVWGRGAAVSMIWPLLIEHGNQSATVLMLYQNQSFPPTASYIRGLVS